ncbi:DnaJ-domain-containing protein [Crucibulum laeve]|uniref:DnaJ-domain-containing protein n=1 Tax=Crucibulum laeve TaxID=68775 RepID=A0A5C3MCG1_9AGAR|nr:DnaJ-domain-containing protein [Crucibulum laeve]
MDDSDPVTQFFPDQDSVDLYEVLSLSTAATLDEIKKAYRRLALVYHPDKHAAASDEAKADASTKFQQIGFAYAVLSDEKRKARYDTTGKTDEGFDLGVGKDGWEAYFEEMFERVTRGKLDEMKKEYQGSAEEIEDLKLAYTMTDGGISEIMTYIPHSTHDDEDRFVITISSLINKGELSSAPAWEASVKDEKAKLVRKKQGEKEAKEAEKLAKELGVWDEFYGTGTAGERKGKGKGKGKTSGKDKATDDDEDLGALHALIMKKREKNMDSFFDSLALKYTEPEGTSRKGKKRGRNAPATDESPRKKSRSSAPEITDEEFAKLQEKLFNDKTKSSGSSESRVKRSGKGRKGK